MVANSQHRPTAVPVGGVGSMVWLYIGPSPPQALVCAVENIAGHCQRSAEKPTKVLIAGIGAAIALGDELEVDASGDPIYPAPSFFTRDHQDVQSL